jgi:UDP-N-acetylmuramoyl-L-alanyl-D-glutamate--2,6-diaminopimelate ligase
MKLEHLLQELTVVKLKCDLEKEIRGIFYDSREVRPDALFVAIRGHEVDGHEFIGEAAQKGAVAAVVETFVTGPEEIPQIQVPDAREALSKLAVRFYQPPFKTMHMIGITGTNGKTTTSYLLESILEVAGARPGVIGTINYRYSGRNYPAPVTTPESLDLMKLLREMGDKEITHVIMEVSSHALDQGRTEGCPFKVAVFTNFSRDHLDYHQSMEAYFEAKSLLFRHLDKQSLKGGAHAVVNIDDPKGVELIAQTKAKPLTFGLNDSCQVKAQSIRADMTGLDATIATPWGEKEIHSHLIGDFNIYNILAASAAALSLNLDMDTVSEGIKRLRSVPGRLEPVPNSRGLSIVVDYAHTPDALFKSLKALQPLTEKRLIVVFGCGGDRDKGKRYDMGRVAGENSHLACITSDNPRTEKPLAIIAQIEKGVRDAGLSRLNGENTTLPVEAGYFVEEDRKKAIHRAIHMADRGDMILIAGKGHEDYQIVGRETRHFDDREEAALAVSNWDSSTAF